MSKKNNVESCKQAHILLDCCCIIFMIFLFCFVAIYFFLVFNRSLFVSLLIFTDILIQFYWCSTEWPFRLSVHSALTNRKHFKCLFIMWTFMIYQFISIASHFVLDLLSLYSLKCFKLRFWAINRLNRVSSDVLI